MDVDFFAPDDGTAIQVAYALDECSRWREVGSLVNLDLRFVAARRFVFVTHGDEQVIEEGGVTIEVASAHKFLLQ